MMWLIGLFVDLFTSCSLIIYSLFCTFLFLHDDPCGCTHSRIKLHYSHLFGVSTLSTSNKSTQQSLKSLRLYADKKLPTSYFGDWSGICKKRHSREKGLLSRDFLSEITKTNREWLALHPVKAIKSENIRNYFKMFQNLNPSLYCQAVGAFSEMIHVIIIW